MSDLQLRVWVSHYISIDSIYNLLLVLHYEWDHTRFVNSAIQYRSVCIVRAVEEDEEQVHA